MSAHVVKALHCPLEAGQFGLGAGGASVVAVVVALVVVAGPGGGAMVVASVVVVLGAGGGPFGLAGQLVEILTSAQFQNCSGTPLPSGGTLPAGQS